MTADKSRYGNRRRYPRIDAEKQLILISVASRIDGELLNLSPVGARVSLRSVPPRQGRDVLLRWGAHEVFGHVVWSSGTEAGVAFHKPMTSEDLVETVGADVLLMPESGRRVL